DIATALRRSPKTRVAILGGRYDAATTWWNVVHDISCQFLSPELRANVEFFRYGCGHMAYVDVPTLEAMAHDMEGFYRS
ncbi:MAG: peptidase S10, partial [Atopobiaceae bacterium]|nr:peptidase S10 [Atopobiaceae bacterium]